MKKEELIIRKATLEDAVPIGIVHAQSWRETYAGIVDDEYLQNQKASEWSEQVRGRIQNGLTEILVAEQAGKVVGFADVGPSRNPEIAAGQLHAIYLAPEAFRQGIGTELFNEALKIVKQRRYSSFFVSVFSENIRAVNFYKKMGGKLIGHDCVILEKTRYETDTFFWRTEHSSPEIVMQERTHEKISEINSFYRSVRYQGEASENDKIFLVIQKEKLVGAVRVALEQGVLVLRGMHLDPSLRGLGVGKSLLVRMCAYLDSLPKSCYAIPHDHLLSFYGTIGFQEIPISEAPPFLQERFREYESRGLRVALIRRTPVKV